MYEKYIKRLLDFVLSLIAIIFLSPVLIITALLVMINLGRPVVFKQFRPGKNGKIFKMYKFRSMTDKRDENGNLLSDEKRLTPFGKMLRKTSLDELPELFCILKGDMSIIGPRPQLVRDMVFMTDEQLKRHDVRPGLSGLAQVNGRNNITWEEKINYDLKYIENITFWGDVKLILQTVWKAFVKQENIETDGYETAEDMGDYLLRIGKIDRETYERKQDEAKELLGIKCEKEPAKV